jgi:hypothetical protein
MRFDLELVVRPRQATPRIEQHPIDRKSDAAGETRHTIVFGAKRRGSREPEQGV